MLPSACGLGQHFQDLGHSFSLYGPPSRQITFKYFRKLHNICVTVKNCPRTSDTTQRLSSQTLFLQYLSFSFCVGAFLIPYASFLVLGGVPLFFMELSTGQLLQAGPVTAWTKLSRLFSGTYFNEKKLSDETDELPRKIVMS